MVGARLKIVKSCSWEGRPTCY